MTLTTLLADVYRRCGYATSPASDVTTRITAFLNETQQEILSEPGMEYLRNDYTTFASFSGQELYGLPPTAQRIKSIRDQTNRRVLTPMSLHEYRQRWPYPLADLGTPSFWVPIGLSPVEFQPETSQQLTVISTSASDVQTAYLEGFQTNSVGFGTLPFSTSVTVGGLVSTAIGPTNCESVTKFYLSSVAVGEVRLRRATTTIISRIVAGQTNPHYRQIALAPAPSSAITYYVDFERTATDLVNGTDEPVIPPSFHRLLAIGARMREYEKQMQMDRYTAAKVEYINGMKKLKYWAFSEAVGSPNLRGLSNERAVNSAVNVATS